MVVVTAGRRGQEIGRLLIERAVSGAALRGYEYLAVRRPAARNISTIREFYEAGFRTRPGFPAPTRRPAPAGRGRQALIDETAPNGCSASFELCRPTARATRAESAIRSLVLLSICNRFLLSQLSCRSPDAVMCTQSLWLYMDPAVNVSTPLNRTAVRVRLGRHVGRLRSAARSAGTRAVISESRRRWPLSSHHCRAIDLSVEPNMLTFPAGISTVESTWVGCYGWCLA